MMYSRSAIFGLSALTLWEMSASVFNYVLDLCKEVIRESVKIYAGRIFRRQVDFPAAMRFP